MTTVNFGTRAHATAVTIFAPSLAMPWFSYLRPTMKPVMFCRNKSGMPRRSASCTKCAPFNADSENRMPLLATIATGRPSMCAKPVTSVSPYTALNSLNSDASTSRAMTSRTSYGVRVSRGNTP